MSRSLKKNSKDLAKDTALFVSAHPSIRLAMVLVVIVSYNEELRVKNRCE